MCHTARLDYSVPMTSTATAALWALALAACYLTLAPVLDFLNSTFATFTIGL